jgi:hypothetical protein
MRALLDQATRDLDKLSGTSAPEGADSSADEKDGQSQ